MPAEILTSIETSILVAKFVSIFQFCKWLDQKSKLITFSFVYNGYKRSFKEDDFWQLDDSDSAKTSIGRLENEWNKEYKKYHERNKEFVIENGDANFSLVIIYSKLK